MMKEIATITVIQGEKTEFERVLHNIVAYLDGAQHCTQYVLTRGISPEETHSMPNRHSSILNCEWDSREYRVLAWNYFSRLFAMAELEIHVALVEQSAEKLEFSKSA